MKGQAGYTVYELLVFILLFFVFILWVINAFILFSNENNWSEIEAWARTGFFVFPFLLILR